LYAHHRKEIFENFSSSASANDDESNKTSDEKDSDFFFAKPSRLDADEKSSASDSSRGWAFTNFQPSKPDADLTAVG
jgi:hypothetical protein